MPSYIQNRGAHGDSSLMLSTLVLSNENRLPDFAGGSPHFYKGGRMSRNVYYTKVQLSEIVRF